MKSLFTFKKILLSFLFLLLVIQFFRIDTTNPLSDVKKDFITASKPPLQIVEILKKACYDCHSNTTIYPWYSQVAPVSWWVKDHVNSARKELNFSMWTDYSPKRKEKKLEEAIDEVLEGEMPLTSYTLIHKTAKLNSSEKKLLADFFKNNRHTQLEEKEE